MALIKYKFKPGIDREGTSYSNEGGWFDCNLVRFRMGLPEKFGGWSKLISDTFKGTARSIFNWIALDGTRYLGLGTHLKFYIQVGDTFDDITPIRKTSTNSITFAKVADGSSSIKVTDSNHGANPNDFVTFSQAVSLGGNITADVLNQEYQIQSISTANSNDYFINAKDTSGNAVTANSSDTGNGGSGVDGVYQIITGLDVFVEGTGWGSGAWSAGSWGSSNALSSANQLRIWSQDNFGEDLVMNVRGGGIFRWDESTGTSTRAVELSSIAGANLVPTKGLQVLTSETNRHLIVLGSDPITDGARTGSIDPMLVSFSSSEDLLDFESRTTNTAGDVRLSSGSQIIGGIKSRQEIIIFTDTSMYSMTNIGPPLVFAINLIDESTGIIAPKACVNVASGIYFMGKDAFYSYDGSVKELACTVKNYVFSDFNTSQAFKTFAFTNKKHSEVGWFYPSASSDEIDRYVIYNYQEGVWYYGQLTRTAWLDSGVVSYPQATANNYLYQHEIGFNDDGSEMQNVFIESGDLDIQDGDNFSFLRRLIPDVKFLTSDTSTNVNFETKVRSFPGDSLSTVATSTVSSSTKQANIRGRGRQVVLKIKSNDGDSGNNGVGWRLGDTRLEVQPDGRR